MQVITDTRIPVPAFSSPKYFFMNIFFYFAYGFLTLERKFLSLSFTVDIQLPVLWPISGSDLFFF